MKNYNTIITTPIKYLLLGLKFIIYNKITITALISLLIFFINRTYCYKQEIIEYESDNIIEKGIANIDYYYNDSKQTENILKKSIAASELINCINEKVDINTLPDNLKSIINELNNFYNSSNQYFSFLYKDIYTGFTISYNEKQMIQTASTIKAPAMIYLYELASKGEINLEEKLTYTSNFYSGGSGVLQYHQPGGQYTVEQLIQYAIYHSDNIAYRMLMNRFGRANMYNFWKAKGTEHIFKYDTIWGFTSSQDASIYMQELYDFYLSNNTHGETLMNYFKKAGWKQITNKDGEYNTANKGGWAEEAFHDAAIVFEENPYILVVMTKTGNSDYITIMKKTNKLIGTFHEEYWKYKMTKCNNIKQY